jgi:hypothetical protein
VTRDYTATYGDYTTTLVEYTLSRNSKTMLKSKHAIFFTFAGMEVQHWTVELVAT